MPTDREVLERIRVLVTEHFQSPNPSRVIPVTAGANLQAAYTAAPAGATLALEPSATFDGFMAHPKEGANPTNRVTVTTRDWQDCGPGIPGLIATKAAQGRMATIRPIDRTGFGIDVPNGEASAGCLNLYGLNILPVGPEGAGAHVRIGNGQATTTEGMAHHVSIRQVICTGDLVWGTKRGIEQNGADVDIDQLWAAEIFRPGQDTQAVGSNVGRRTRVTHSYLVAGGENILIGGDIIRGPGMTAEDWTIEDCILHKPFRWRPLNQGGDGLNRQVKNLFELKAVKRCTVRRCLMTGNWAAAQDGRGILLNYTTNGNSPYTDGLEDVLLEDIALLNSAGGVNFQGFAWQTDSHNSKKLLRATVRHLYYHGGTVLPLAMGNVKDRHDIALTRCTFAHKANKMLGADYGWAWEGDPAVRVRGGPMHGFSLTDSVFTSAGRYQITAPGAYHYATGLKLFCPVDCDVRGNVIGDAVAGLLRELNAPGVGSGNVMGEQMALEAMCTPTSFGEPLAGKGADPVRLQPVLEMLSVLPEA